MNLMHLIGYSSGVGSEVKSEDGAARRSGGDQHQHQFKHRSLIDLLFPGEASSGFKLKSLERETVDEIPLRKGEMLLDAILRIWASTTDSAAWPRLPTLSPRRYARNSP
mmetsp:Transcript_46202/g.100405  ORF Transcript_46202/g.100405 Transcript_46202/m.100405 type:complete len:109 (-) Transcript_46202:1438-1764(-)